MACEPASGDRPAAHGLWLVRHARPLVEPGVCYGATDMPADAAATQRCARELAPVLPAGVRVLASPLQRCDQLARALQRERPELVVESDPRLAEMDFGAWEGWYWADIPKSAIDAWVRDFGQLRFGGRESVQQLMDRVASIRSYSLSLGTPVVWLTHAGVMRSAQLLSRRITQLHRADQWPLDGAGFGQWRVL